MYRRTIALIFASLLVVGCASNDTKPIILDNTDEQCEALKTVKFPDDLGRPLDLSAYKSVDVDVTIVEGERLIILSEEEMKQVIMMLHEVSQYIEEQQFLMKSTREYYERNLAGEGVDQ